LLSLITLFTIFLLFILTASVDKIPLLSYTNYERTNEQVKYFIVAMNMKIPEYIKIQKYILESLLSNHIETILPIRELAKTYEASLDTVHKALKILEKESFIYKDKRCYKAYKGLSSVKITNYINHLYLSNVKSEKIEKVSIFMTSSLTPYYFELADLIILELQKRGIETNIFRIPFSFPEEINKEYERLKKNLERNQALIFLPSLHKECASIISNCRRRRIKTVVFGGKPIEHVNNIIIDSYVGSFDALRYLASLNRHRVGYASGVNKDTPKTSHFYAYQKAVLDGFIEDSAELLFPADFERIRNGIFEYGRLAAEYFSSLKQPPDAVFFGDDVAAATATNIFREKGFRVPDDISVVGINGSDAAALSGVEIATVVYPKDKIANTFVESALSELNWDKSQDTVIKSVFRKGNSCSKKREK